MIKLFLADTKSYVSLDLNKLAGNTHLFKLTGELSLENITLKKNWIWDVLEIKWEDICIVLHKEVHTAHYAHNTHSFTNLRSENCLVRET